MIGTPSSSTNSLSTNNSPRQRGSSSSDPQKRKPPIPPSSISSTTTSSKDLSNCSSRDFPRINAVSKAFSLSRSNLIALSASSTSLPSQPRCCENKGIMHRTLQPNELGRIQIIFLSGTEYSWRVNSIPNAVKPCFEPGRMPNPAFDPCN